MMPQGIDGVGPHWDVEVKAELPSAGDRGSGTTRTTPETQGDFIHTEIFWSFWEADSERLRPLGLSKWQQEVASVGKEP